MENTQWKFCLLSRRVGRAGLTVVCPSSCWVVSCNEGTGKLRNKTRLTNKRHHNTAQHITSHHNTTQQHTQHKTTQYKQERQQNATKCNATQPKNSTEKIGQKTLHIWSGELPQDHVSPPYSGCEFKVTPDLRGCLWGIHSFAHHFKGKHGKLISLESLRNVDFGKKYKLPVSSILQKKITNNHENDHVSFNWINRVSNPSALAK